MPSPAINGDLVGQKLGKYELLALIAVGGTAEIYLARISGASGFEKYLVVKCLLDHLADDQEFVRMFLDEARVSAQLDNSNIVQTLELGEHKGRYFLVMEYLAGMSVAQMARKTQERGINGGLIDPNLVFGMAAQTCAGLHYAHSKMMNGKTLNLVHRDISPQNLVVSFEGILKIVDFGIAKSDMREVHTRTGTIKGKFAYMSPEQCLAKKVDHRTDIFALGTLCHELLTGRRLFKRQTTYDTYQAIVNGGVPTPSSINPKLDSEVDRVIMKALAYEPEGRYNNAQAFGEALLGLLHHRGGSGGPGEISRFFDEYFGEDLDAHANQMRELVTGRRAPVDEHSWDSDVNEDEDLGSASTRASTAKPVLAKKPLPSIKAKGPSPSASAKLGSIPMILPKAPDPNIDASDDDEGPTRIEFEPGDRIAALHDNESDVDSDWTAPTKLSPAANETEGTRPESLGASPMDVGELANDEPGPLPPIPPARTPPPPPPGASPRRDFATPPATIEVQAFHRDQQGQPQQGQPQQGQPQQGQPQQGQPQQVNMTLMGQPAFQTAPPGTPPPAGAGADAQRAMPPLVRPQLQNNPYGQPQYASGPQPQMVPPMPHQDARPAVSKNSQQGMPPLWIHALIFAAFVGLGVGVAAFIKMVL